MSCLRNLAEHSELLDLKEKLFKRGQTRRRRQTRCRGHARGHFVNMNDRDMFFLMLYRTRTLFIYSAWCKCSLSVACIIMYVHLSMLHTHTQYCTSDRTLTPNLTFINTRSDVQSTRALRCSAAKKVCGLGKQTELPGSVSVSVSAPP